MPTISKITNALELKNPFKGEGTVFGYHNWKRIKVIKQTPEGVRTFHDVIDESTGDVYDLRTFHHGSWIRRVKAFDFVFITPFYAAATIIFHLGKAAYLTIKYVAIIFGHIALNDHQVKELVIEDLKEMGEKVGRCFANVLRTPLYAFGIFVGSIVMFVEPINGNKIVHKIEKTWSHGLELDHLIGPTNLHIGKNWNSNDSMVIGHCYFPKTTLSKMNADPYVTYEIAETNHPFLHFIVLSLWG